MDEMQRYLFDVQGYLILEDVIPLPVVRRLESLMDELEARDPETLPASVVPSKPRTASELYLSNIVEAGPEFEELIDVPEVVDVVREVSLGLFRLNHTYAIYHFKDGWTPLHMGATPIHPKAHYEARGGQIFSTLTKAVFPIANHTAADGCFAAIPGSHKASFALPESAKRGSGQPPRGLVPIEAKPGDAIVFTEALTHGSFANVSGNCRKSLFYCYSLGYMPDWTKLELEFSPELIARVSEERREILRLKVT